MKGWKRGAVTGAVLAGALLVTGVAVAVAQEPAEPGPVTVTLTPEQVTSVCERLSKLESRTAPGTAEGLRARAAHERDAGRETTAQLLEERAERRAARADRRAEILRQTADFRAEHCGTK